ncbi:MAG: tetratricopeptide repeat protein, partial [Roseimicrobium sp.]
TLRTMAERKIRTIAMKNIVLLTVAAALAAVVSSPVFATDLHVTYEEGRAAFNAGEYELAREKLSEVLSRNPTHLPTRAMMAQIERVLGANNVALRKAYEKVIIDKIEFADVELAEALTAVRVKAKQATHDKVVPNVIVKSPELAKKLVSINLTQIPLTEVLHYLAQLAGARVTYDKSAVLLSSYADVPAPAATPAPSAPTAPDVKTHRSPGKLQEPFRAVFQSPSVHGLVTQL